MCVCVTSGSKLLESNATFDVAVDFSTRKVAELKQAVRLLRDLDHTVPAAWGGFLRMCGGWCQWEEFNSHALLDPKSFLGLL